ncbi:uncharacterized protein LOC114250204 [Bombyx mandarina]|uniref:Uncharacterized protein LOC114250204 n=1 Tax=Bombyx mandarina TaxID=7092 RepID=A0A6J2KHV0_BOMMA|nr:uncharacterized protein LOC114250204 [Bombyx mandarina]
MQTRMLLLVWLCAGPAAAGSSCDALAAEYVNGAMRTPRVVSVVGQLKNVSVVWSAEPARAAGALLGAVLRHALGYRRVRLARSSPALCELECRQHAAPDRLQVVPAATSGAECRRRRALLSVGRATAPLSASLYARLSGAARADPACRDARLWTAYSDPAQAVSCQFLLTSGRIDIYTTAEVRDAAELSSVVQRAAAAELRGVLHVLSRAELHRRIATDNASFLILDYKLWDDHELLVPVSFPARSCGEDVESTRTEFVIHEELEAYAPILYSVAERFDPTPREVRAVLDMAARRGDGDVEEAACQWAAEYPIRFQSWIPQYDDDHHVLVLLCNERDNYNYTPLFQFVIHKLQQYTGQLKINILIKDELVNCSNADDPHQVLNNKTRMSRIYRCIGVAAGAADAATVARVARDAALPLVLYDTPARVPPGTRSSACSLADLVTAIEHFIVKTGWRRIVTLSERTEFAEAFVLALRSSVSLITKDIDLTENVTEALNTVEELDGRVIIVNAGADLTAAVVREAAQRSLDERRGMAWLVRAWAPANPTPIPLFYLRCGCRKAENQFNHPNAASLADAVLTLGYGFAAGLMQDYSVRDDPAGRNLERFWQISDSISVDGLCESIKYEAAALAKSTVLVDKLSVNGNSTLGILIVRDGRVSSEPNEMEPYGRDGEVPYDGRSRCSMPIGDPFHPHCLDALCVVVGILLSLAVPLLLMAHRHLASVIRPAKLPPVTQELTRFLVDPAHLVTYDILGTGRFGRVHLGVLQVPGKAPRPVAVKSLRKGAAPAEETEFLNEAVIMAALDHEHIIRFVGACVAKGPPLVLMEHAFFGDLRRYLRERRHFAEQSDHLSQDSKDFEESEHVSAEALTQLASEAALALEHLARRGVVHRDVRASNCLVDSRRRLKLGDFGMARKTDATGADGAAEYACRRRGLFPVLWMAPESLSRGAFSSASDVWSLGVLMLETVTLGDRPYGSWSPLRVLQHVSSGGRPELPFGAAAEARGVASACWRRAACERPAAGEVARYLRDHPRALRPVLRSRVAPDADSGFGESDPPSP